MDLFESNWNGRELLEETLRRAGFNSIGNAIAQLTVFSNPQTVSQTNNKALFRTIRQRQNEKIGSINHATRTYIEQNHSVQAAFSWCNGLPCLNRRKDIQFNHIWQDSRNVDTYTSLANICVTPAFLAKPTDSADISKFLKYRSYELYNFWPSNTSPAKPEGYDLLQWNNHFADPIQDIETALRTRMDDNRSNHAVKASIALGWLFGSYE